ncbi:hypothetical protein ACF1BE_28980 [Streptomyces sp. NPDC014991]|uniref:hypothetical protein n=1 Tax=Streptomyces sp. NPDC014991 TaxID=3364935 RepID=UPI0036FD8211
MWHIPVNRLTDVNEERVRGREGIPSGWQFATKAARRLPDHVVDHYVRMLAHQPAALRGSFGWYRATPQPAWSRRHRLQRKAAQAA